MSEQTKLDTVLKALAEKKAGQIEVYDTRNVTPFMDYMVVASSQNTRQNGALSQNVLDRLKEADLLDEHCHIEGNRDSNWILVDLGDIVVNLFIREERGLYQLDRLYSDCPAFSYDL